MVVSGFATASSGMAVAVGLWGVQRTPKPSSSARLGIPSRGDRRGRKVLLCVCRRAMAWVGTEEEVAQLIEMADGEVVAAQKEITQLNKDTDASVFGNDRANGEAIMNAFKLFDADGDGKLTFAEVMAVLTRKTPTGNELSEEDARATWRRWQQRFDRNNDGKISYEELVDDMVAHPMRWGATSVIEELAVFAPSD